MNSSSQSIIFIMGYPLKQAALRPRYGLFDKTPTFKSADANTVA